MAQCLVTAVIGKLELLRAALCVICPESQHTEAAQNPSDNGIALLVQGDSPDDLKRAVGHLSNSALPGQQGNVALAAHRDTFSRPLRDIRVGDEIKFKTRERNFDYVVESMEVVAPTDVRVLQSSVGHDLTLLTCYPFHYIGPAPKRFVVFAREIKPTSNTQPSQYQ